jgi:hypothetical protein
MFFVPGSEAVEFSGGNDVVDGYAFEQTRKGLDALRLARGRHRPHTSLM